MKLRTFWVSLDTTKRESTGGSTQNSVAADCKPLRYRIFELLMQVEQDFSQLSNYLFDKLRYFDE
jgi:hypothetical protein